MGVPKTTTWFTAAAFLAAWIFRIKEPGFPFPIPIGGDPDFSAAMAGSTSDMEFTRPGKRFAWAGDFSGGLAPVEVDGRYGWIDSSGDLVLPALREGAGAFSGGRAPFQADGLWGYLDVTGAEAIAPVYAWAGPFREGLAVVADDSGFGFIDTAGNRIGRTRFTDARDFSGGFAAVRFGSGENYAWGFIDRAGSLAIEPVFTEAPSGFSEGMARVRVETDRPWRTGFIDSSGGFAIDTLFDAAGDFREGLAAVGWGEWRGTRFEGRWGYIDSTGTVVVETRFAEAGPFRNGRALVRLETGAWAHIGRNGRVMREFRADLDLAGAEEGPLVTYKVRGRLGLFDPETGAATLPVLAEAGSLRQGWARVRLAGETGKVWAFLGRNGAWLGGPEPANTH